CLRRRDAGLEPANNTEPIVAAGVVLASVGDRERNPQHNRWIRKLKRARHHPDDRVLISVERHRLIRETGLIAESPLPQTLAQDHDAMLAKGLFFAGKHAAALGGDAKHAE